MKLYLKYGQVVDLGNVLEVVYEDNTSIKPLKYANNGDEVYGIADRIFEENNDCLVQFYNDKNEVFECYKYDVVGVLEERQND